MASPYRINLPAYEGPLDLLLDLIRKQEMDIHNIPIAKITEQYLDYLHQLEKFKNAAQLLYQKQQVEANVWSHPDKSLYGGDEVQGELVVSLVDLVKTFQQVLERRK